jgi:hypothetical protein
MDPEKQNKTFRIPLGYQAGNEAALNSDESSACSISRDNNLEKSNTRVILEPVSACDAHSLALLFKPVYKPIIMMPPGYLQEEALLSAAGLEAEARRGDLADAQETQRYMLALGSSCPDALRAIVNLFSGIIPGISPVFREALSTLPGLTGSGGE